MRAKIVFLLLIVSTSTIAKEVMRVKFVKIYFLEAIAPKDTTSSKRFETDYELAIKTAKQLSQNNLEKCGYDLQTKSVFYDASEPIQAKVEAENATADGVWLLVGPRRSNHYLLLGQGAPDTPSVSLMASSEEVMKMGNLHLSLSPVNARMVETAVEEALRLSKKSDRKGYISIVSEDCLSCKDFASQFDWASRKKNQKKLDEIRIAGELPDPSPIIDSVKRNKPAYILLPSYSKTVTHIMNAIVAVDSDLFFVGGDGWGDSKYGFVQSGQALKKAKGFTVRGLPPFNDGLKTFELGRLALELKDRKLIPSSGPALAILKAIDSTVRLLCGSKPSNKKEFATAFEVRGKGLFASPWGTSIYKLEKGNLLFQESKVQ